MERVDIGGSARNQPNRARRLRTRVDHAAAAGRRGRPEIMTARLVALIVLMAGAGTAAGAEFGRMFFTPAQRAALDNFRAIRTSGMQSSARMSETRIWWCPPPAPEHVSVNGMVRRSDGKNTVWINNRAVGAQQPRGINVAPGKSDNQREAHRPAKRPQRRAQSRPDG